MDEGREVTRWGKVPAWWLLHEGIDADRFCVLAAMATYADEEGLCDPSQATLARRLKRSRPWVNRIVAQLAAEGFLEKTARARRNGGTTSCLYRLRFAPGGPVADATGHDSAGDSPRHRHDTSQPEAEQSHDRAPRRGAAAGAHDEPLAEVPADWMPGQREVAEALRLCPDADLDAHTARFRARCRARGYRYRASATGDAWLAWLLEDHRDGRRRKGGQGMDAAEPRRPPAPNAGQRFAAWAAAASVPASPWS